MRDAHALTLAQNAIDASSITAVALKIGFSRTALSLYMNDKYPAEPEAIESAIRTRFDQYPCNFTNEVITGQDCQQRANQPKPFGGRAKLTHWLACQSCPMKGNKQ